MGRVLDLDGDFKRRCKGVDLAGERLPQVSYPATFPKPVEVIDSQYEFVTALLAAQHQLVKAVVETVAPLYGAQAPTAPAKAKATTATKSAA